MNKAELTARMAARTSLFKAGANTAVSAVFSDNADTLARGQPVTIAGFGTFSTKLRLARQGRTPRTGETISITASNVPSFKVRKTLPDAVN